MYRVTAVGSGTLTLLRVSELNTTAMLMFRDVIVKNNVAITSANLANSVWSNVTTLGASSAFALASDMSVVSSANNAITYGQQYYNVGTGLQVTAGALSIIQGTAMGTSFTNTQTPTLAYLSTMFKRYTRAVTGGSVTLVEGETMCQEIQFTGTLTSNLTVLTVASVTYNRRIVITNGTTGAYTMTFNGVSIPQGYTVELLLTGIQTAVLLDIRQSVVSIATTGGATTLTPIQSNSTYITVTGTLTSGSTITPQSSYGVRFINNATTGAYAVTIGGLVIPQGSTVKCFQNGTSLTLMNAIDSIYGNIVNGMALVSNEAELVWALTSANVKAIALLANVTTTATSASLAIGSNKAFVPTGFNLTLGAITHTWTGGFTLFFYDTLFANTSCVLNLTGALKINRLNCQATVTLTPSIASNYQVNDGTLPTLSNTTLVAWFTPSGSTGVASQSTSVVESNWSGNTNYEYTVTIAGATVGQTVSVSPDSNLYSAVKTAGSGFHYMGVVTSANTVKVTMRVDTYITTTSCNFITKVS